MHAHAPISNVGATRLAPDRVLPHGADRVVITDHGAFVLINVYAPNAGDAPARPRVDFKCRFLAALKERMDALVAQGRQASMHVHTIVGTAVGTKLGAPEPLRHHAWLRVGHWRFQRSAS